MPVSKRRHTSSRGKRRRSHKALTPVGLVKNAKGNLARPHRVSPIDGTYKNREVVKPKIKKSKPKA